MPVFRDDALPEGYLLLRGLLSPLERLALGGQLEDVTAGAAGERDCLDRPWCQALARWLLAHPVLQGYLPCDPVAVQCTLFEKSADCNWLVTPHQDLAIPVAERIEHEAMHAWSVKGGRHFVLAPAELLSQLLAVRLHVDDAAVADGGLRFVPRSHLDGVLDDADVPRWKAAGEVAVDARAGDALLMRPLVLHASSKATNASGRRRVLHFLFGPARLPFGVRWHVAA
ncbi:MAG: phytanoyl-CoA dioxygenase [Rubrivivax sp.]|nr:MAG: phytanoyl-CoA dioxygenase [Rubrivivax sp.]